MAEQEQTSSGLSRYLSRYIGAFIGTVLGASAGIAEACKKRVMAARGRGAEISEEVMSKVPEPVSERAAAEQSDEVGEKGKVEEAQPAVPEEKAKAKAKPKPKAKGKPKPKAKTKAKAKPKTTTNSSS